MAVYCISYDLKSGNYDDLIQAIKDYGKWWHQSESTWFIETSQAAKDILTNLKAYTNSGDKLIVIKVQRNWWAVGHTDEEYEWMKKRNY
ncbi:hypothetical protein [Carboxylicivirga taeanensis]|uniref:hypothetical protein n=1 Tax=Carboxylicivirga taeanensis TaxID=1416875 RepID=UPI003F6DB3B7